MIVMGYVVVKDFLDRFDNMKHCKPGDPHEPPNEERAKQLMDQGFIAAVEKVQGTKRKMKNKNGDGDGK